MVNDIATLCPAVTTLGYFAETRVCSERDGIYPAMADRVACLRDQIERGIYKADLPALAAAMLGFDSRQKSDDVLPSKI